MNNRNGKRKVRRKYRIPRLGYYIIIIITDAKETEQNYIMGLRNSIPKELQNKLVIKVSKAKTEDLVNEAINLVSLHPQYGEPWIIFDRDRVKDFDEIISCAIENNINAVWSNPCIETWFNAYFGAMPSCIDSVSCCNCFSKQYEKITKKEYKKADEDIYFKLCSKGNEEKAIEIAKSKYKGHLVSGKAKPSEMSPCTTMYTLVEEIKNKIKNGEQHQ